MRFILFIALLIILTSATTNTRNNYPVPEKTNERLFFIQRSLNSNTIVYDANFDKNGNLIEESPIDVYWIRYDECGQRMELRKIEKNLAFGIEFSKLDQKGYHYKVNIIAEKSRDIFLKQEAPFRAKAYLKIGDRMSELSYLYLESVDGIIPGLKSIEIFGIDTLNRKNTYEKVLY